MRRVAAVLPLALCAAAAACATARPLERPGRAESTVVIPNAPFALASRDLIPTRTLDLDPGLSLYDVVARYWPQVLRPQVMVPTAPSTVDPRGDVVGIYIDQNFAGGQEQLRSIRASAVSAIRRLTPSEEYVRYGRSHAGGGLILTFR
jgi:hypothetical protein